MSEFVLSEEVRVLLFDTIHTFEQLEALLLLRRNSTREWSAFEVARQLEMPRNASVMALEHLARNGLAEARDDGHVVVYRYSTINRTVDDTVGSLAIACDASSAEVMRVMSHNAVERLRTSALRTFADAGLFKSDRAASEDGD